MHFLLFIKHDTICDMNKVKIAPSILSADFSDIQNDLSDIKIANADLVHLDVMDGYFVPNITFGPKFIKDIRRHSDMIFDTHLMVINPERYIKNFAESGSDYITIHVEACNNPAETLALIKSYGCKAGIAINPETDISEVLPYLDIVDLILVMTVHPGFGGQKFIYDCLDKVKTLKEVRGSRDYLISVDGGVNDETAPEIIESGVDILVTGSAFFNSINKKEYINYLHNI